MLLGNLPLGELGVAGVLAFLLVKEFLSYLKTRDSADHKTPPPPKTNGTLKLRVDQLTQEQKEAEHAARDTERIAPVVRVLEDIRGQNSKMLERMALINRDTHDTRKGVTRLENQINLGLSIGGKDSCPLRNGAKAQRDIDDSCEIPGGS